MRRAVAGPGVEHFGKFPAKSVGSRPDWRSAPSMALPGLALRAAHDRDDPGRRHAAPRRRPADGLSCGRLTAQHEIHGMRGNLPKLRLISEGTFEHSQSARHGGDVQCNALWISPCARCPQR